MTSRTAQMSATPRTRMRRVVSEEDARSSRVLEPSHLDKALALFARPHVLLISALLLAILMLYGPIRDCYVAWRTGITLGQRYDAALIENEEISEDINKLMTRDGIEDAARSMGYVPAGETVVVVRGLPEEEAELESTTSEEALPWYVGPLDVIFFFEE